ncbi:MAG TPA: TetR/AcrR family transcriptional regulator [Solirubrobacteraceae bacterium]|nr:TetR/AcrR family transcriptional regulator [Solirubrobacteraceae bacterium]
MKRCVLRQGLDATTLREIGREAGFTTGVITHHFPDKAAVVRACFETISGDWIGDVELRLARAASVHEKFVELVRIALPLEPDSQREWRLWAEMWAYAGTDPEFVPVLIEVDARWERQVLRLLYEARGAGLLRAEVDVELQAGIVVRLIDGLGLRSWLSGGWDPARRQLTHHVASLMSDPDAERRLLELAETPLAEAAR